MRLWLLALPALALAACEKDDTGSVAGAITGSLAFDDEESAEVNVEVAYGFDQGERALLYFPSNPVATCADVATYLGHDNHFDPTNLFAAGHCNLSAVITVYDGAGVDLAGDALSSDVSWSLNCTIGEGVWQWEERDDDDGYYWSGRWWLGGPGQWSLSASGGGGSDFEAEAEMNDYHGNYTEEFKSAGAEGLVSGSMAVTWCPDLVGNPLI
ncbi:MAG: hypothetical protein ABIO70_22400 [Pseudomonadota bacterium]